MLAIGSAAMGPMMNQAANQAAQSSGGQLPGGFGQMLTGMLAAAGVVAAIVAALGIVFLIFLWQGRNWARIACIVYAIVGLLFSLPGIASQHDSTSLVMQVMVIGFNAVFLYALFNKETQDYCRE